MGLEDKGTAFLLVFGAGLSTCLGASLVYHPKCINLASKKTLAGSLGVSCGVMLYVSFVEIFSKSQAAFEEYGIKDSDAYLYATLCFFGGFVIMMLLDKLVHLLDPDNISHMEMNFEMMEKIQSNSIDAENDMISGKCFINNNDNVDDNNVYSEGNSNEDKNIASSSSSSQIDSEQKGDGDDSIDNKKKKLERMGLVTGLAIGIHNFPEGLATFVATLDDPVVGAALAVAIAIHNIPEGICVAMPIYFATGNRHKAFFWAFLSGASEIVAAALGWIVLSNVTNQLVYAVLFGLVAGMMVNICAYKLIPTAHKYDPSDAVVSHSMLVGMVIMAISLVSFLY